MAKMGDMDISEFVKLRDNLNKLSDPETLDMYMRECVAEIAMQTLKRTIKLTPVGKTLRLDVVQKDENGQILRNKSGKIKTKKEVVHTGGTLRRGWTAKTQVEAENGKGTPTGEEINEAAKKLRVSKIGNTYIAWIINPVDYASYVEYGHRQEPGRYVPVLGKRLKKSWVQGRHMLQISMQEVEAKLPEFLDAKLQDYLNQIFGGNG
ncbi:MAG: HK97 gp10 family phage protein [Clostridia bacterium]|nr:HK97 gp10 family phage protein [Clostridia bacterium]